MAAPFALLHRMPGAGVLDPFNLGAYVTWLAVALSASGRLTAGTPLTAPVVLGLGALAGHLLLFVARAWLDGREAALPQRQAVVSGQLLCALLVCWGLGLGLQHAFSPALLVIAAGQLPLVFATSVVLPLLLAANGVLAALLLQAYGGFNGVLLLLAWCGFQTFAAVGCVFAVRLQAMGLTALRINAELMSTRQLLDEGARAEERLRLSRELHDVAGHKLTALKMQLALHRDERWRRRSAPLEESQRLADELLQDIRGVVSTLRANEGVDLPSALRALDPGLPRPRVVFDIEPGLLIADMRRADALLRCAQEALTNALRHSRAVTVQLRLGFEREGLVLAVEDDGRGRLQRLQEGNGIRGMRERLGEVGGRLELREQRSGGLVLRAILPGLAPPFTAEAELRTGSCESGAGFCAVRKFLHADDRAGG